MRNKVDTNKLAVVYPRQSTGEQVENNVFSLERQLQLSELARRDGFDEAKIYLIDDDLGLSGRTITKRPGFMRALDLIERGDVAVIYVEDLTRLSRDERTIDHMIIADACRRSGTLIYMARSWYDMRDASQRAAFKYQAVGFSEYWGQHLVKLHENRLEKARQGKAVTRIPRGYRVCREGKKSDPGRDKLVPHEPEAEVIKLLVERLLVLGSVRELMRQTADLRWPDGHAVSWSTVKKLLTNPILRGDYVWGEVVVPNAHPAIITPEQAAAIDRLSELNRATKRKENPRAGGLLAGLVWCPTCNRKMESNTANHSPAYRCQVSKPGAARDYHFGLHGGKVDVLVLGDLMKRLDDGLVDRIVQRLQEMRQTVLAIRDKGDGQRKSLARMIEGYSLSLANPDLPQAARRHIEKELDHTAKELELLNAQAPRVQELDAELRNYRDLKADPSFIGFLLVTWNDEPLQWRRSFIRRFIERVHVLDEERQNTVVVHYLDGQIASLLVPKRGWTAEEKAALMGLIDHPQRPAKRYVPWLEAQMKQAGFSRTRSAIHKFLAQQNRLRPSLDPVSAG